jgi:hypothetical protein
MLGLKSQVLTNRGGFAVLVHAGIPGAQHDLSLLRRTLPDIEQLIMAHPGQPCEILADKAYIGDIGSRVVRLVTRQKQLPNRFLNSDQVRDNNPLSHHRVVIENFFGRLSGKFRIIIGRWAFLEEFYPKIFRVCCALVNFDILRPGGGLRPEDAVFYRKALTGVIARDMAQEGQIEYHELTGEEIAEEMEVARLGRRGERDSGGGKRC